MKNLDLEFKVALFSFALFAYSFSPSFAQTTPEFLVSWRAINYVPADYLGKILPSKSSRVEAGFDLIDNKKLIDLSKINVSWYLNGQLLNSGTGLKTATININSDLAQTIRITVSSYKGADIDQTFLLPVVKPEIVINTKLINTDNAGNRMRLTPKNHLFEARPFFFNVNNLRELGFRWRVNDKLIEGISGTPEFLSLNLESPGSPTETELTVSSGINNLFNQLEFAGKSLNFIVK